MTCLLFEMRENSWLDSSGCFQDGQQYGDEYLAELDYIEVVERLKEGYESDVNEDEETGEEDFDDDERRASDSDRYPNAHW